MIRVIVTGLTYENLADSTAIWNDIVEDGLAFPQMETLSRETGEAFFEGQTYTGVASDAESGQVLGLYILHPNNVGRCGHICNASYAVKKIKEEIILENIWSGIVLRKHGNWDLEFCSLMRLWNQTGRL